MSEAMPDKSDKLERYEMFYEEIGSYQLFDNNIDLEDSEDTEDKYDQSFLSSDAVSRISLDAHGQDFSEQIEADPQSSDPE